MEMKITFPGKAKVNAEYKGFTIKTDQAIWNGGDNSAPAPFDYFLVSIGTCAGIYVVNFLQQRKIPTDGLYMTLNTTKNREKRMLGEIIIDVYLPESFPEKYKKAIVNAVNLCAVKKHMHDPPKFITNVKIGDKLVLTEES